MFKKIRNDLRMCWRENSGKCISTLISFGVTVTFIMWLLLK